MQKIAKLTLEEAKEEIKTRLIRQEGSEETKKFIDDLAQKAKTVRFLEKAPEEPKTEAPATDETDKKDETKEPQ